MLYLFVLLYALWDLPSFTFVFDVRANSRSLHDNRKYIYISRLLCCLVSSQNKILTFIT